MTKLTEGIKSFIADHEAFVATVGEDGTPNIGSKGSTRVLDDEHIVFMNLLAAVLGQISK